MNWRRGAVRVFDHPPDGTTYYRRARGAGRYISNPTWSADRIDKGCGRRYKDVERYSIERDITALCDRCLYLGSGCHTRQPAVAVRCHGDSLGRQQTLSQWVVCNPTASPFLSRSANTIYLTDGDGLPRMLTAQASKALRRTNHPARSRSFVRF